MLNICSTLILLRRRQTLWQILTCRLCTNICHSGTQHGSSHKHYIYNLLKCFFAGALVIVASSWNIFYTLDTALPEISFPHKKKCRLSCKWHVCGNSFKMKCYIRKHLQKTLVFLGSTFFTNCKTPRYYKWKQ